MAGIIFVIALFAESVVATGAGLTQNDSAAKIAAGLHEHRARLLVIAYLSPVYAVTFAIYLGSLYKLLRGDTERAGILGYLVLVGRRVFFLQGFGLGGVIATFGLVLDLIAIVLILIFVLASSVILLRRGDAVGNKPLAHTG
jgi:hypothetical protein